LPSSSSTIYIGSDFDPLATAAQYPVLLIPSGGLYGLASPPSQGGAGGGSFRARLEEYTRRGGVIIAFDQQHGGANPKSQCPTPNALMSITIVTLYADDVPLWSLVIVHWSLIPACPAYVTA